MPGKLCTTLLCLLLFGCYAEGIEVTEIMSHHQCAGIDRGAQWIQEQDLAGLRGAKFLHIDPAQAETTTASQIDAAQRLLVVSMGQQTTGGYTLALAGAKLADTTLILDMDWQTPAPDTLVTQALTAPCVVVGITGQAPYPETVEVQVNKKLLASVSTTP
ncbi:MAG: protease complex subunit PrcB family protein [Pseudomonadota bacterium]